MRHTPPRRGLPEETTDRLRAVIRKSPEAVLPTMESLATRFGVSRPTVARAAARLRAEGILTYGRGRRMRVRGREAPPPAPRPAAAEALSSSLRKQIHDGRLRSGQLLPKLDALAREHHVSKTTLTAALRRLRREGLLSRVGKTWRVGPPPPPQMGTFSRQAPLTIVALFDSEDTWTSVARSNRTAPFAASFRGEAERYGVRIVAAFTERGHSPPSARLTGPEGVRSLIEELGSCYQGTLMPGMEPSGVALVEWVELLAHFDKPVVSFDRHDTRPLPRPETPLFTRCHFSEEAAIELAVKHLVEAGHREAVVAVPDPGGWQSARARMLAEAGARLGITVHTAAAGGSPPPEQVPADRLRGYRPLVEQVLALRDATALIVPRDYTAYYFYHILTSLGIGIPRRMSLLSFNNSDRLFGLPISTIDFGFGYLGYAAFHTLFGVIRPSRTADGDIGARPSVVDRGSVAAPRRRALQVSRTRIDWGQVK